MPRQIYSKHIEYRLLFAVGTLALIGMLLVFPIRLLLGEFYFDKVSSILDDKTTAELDRMDLSAESAAAYQAAMASIDAASALVPSKAFYQKVLANMHFQLARWSRVMEDMNIPPVAGIPSSEVSLETAIKHLKQAVALDPVNPDYHLAIGQMYEEINNRFDKADRELHLAVGFYPINAGLRYAVAMEYLLHSHMDQALGQAKALAGIDESYRMDENDPGCILAREKRSSWYLSRLMESHLFKSMEIAWRASRKDMRRVASIVPHNVDAQETARLFFESKGIAYDGLH